MLLNDWNAFKNIQADKKINKVNKDSLLSYGINAWGGYIKPI